MDSCQLFNFLFGSKKASAELNRCFASMRNAGVPNPSGTSPTPSGSTSAPSSPLKHIQARLASFATSSKRNVNSAANSIVSEIFKQPAGEPNASHKSQQVVQHQQQQTQPRGEHLGFEDNFQDDMDSDKNKRASGCYRATLIEYGDGEDEQLELRRTSPVTGDQRIDQNSNLDESKDMTDEQLQAVAIEQSAKSATNKLPDAEQAPKPLMKHRRMVLYEELEPAMADSDTDQSATWRSTIDHTDKILASARVYGLASEGGLKQIGTEKTETNPTADVAATSKFRPKTIDDISEETTSARRERVRNLVQSIESQLSLDRDDSMPRSPLRDQNYSPRARPQPSSKIETSSLNGSARLDFESIIDFNNNNATSPHQNQDHHDIDRWSPRSTSGHRPVTLVKPLPPKTPPKSNKALYLNLQLGLNKPQKIQQLFQDEAFLRRLFAQMEPLDRCLAAQVCRRWRDVLYADRSYWKDLVNVIDCTQLRREHIVDCIISTLQSARQKNQRAPMNSKDCSSGECFFSGAQSNMNNREHHHHNHHSLDPESIESLLEDLDQEDVWRIQELCNRYNHQQKFLSSGSTNGTTKDSSSHACNNNSHDHHHNHTHGTCSASKSSSIPSQISSTLSSSHSLSSLLSPLSESNRIDSIREKLYCSIDDRGFDAICLFGATDDDVHDLAARIPSKARHRILVGRLTNCCVTDRGLELFIGTFDRLEELELSGCNEITNALELRPLANLRRLIITDCINIADGLADKLVPEVMGRLEQLTVQAYHLTDTFVEYLCINAPRDSAMRLTRLELPNCKEITNHSLVTIANHLPHLEALSISGSTRICDDGIEALTDKVTRLRCLDLSWCSQITDSSLECIGCYLAETLTDLILDRNTYIMDLGIEHLSSLKQISLLHVRWCSRITDKGLRIISSWPTLRHLSVAGLQLVTAEGLASLAEADLRELELANCSAVSQELILNLSYGMPKCNIIV